jgi:ribosomal protein S18 acetylase RimI-like enzyme
MTDESPDAAIDRARPEELEAAFRLVFRHVQPDERASRVARALELVRLGEFDPAGVLVLRDGRGLAGAFVCHRVAGGSGLVWPPQAESGRDRTEVEDQLVRSGVAWLRSGGAKLAQALLALGEARLGAPLERNGFTQVTQLAYLRHTLELPARLRDARVGLRYQTYADCDRTWFHETLFRTYEGTQDCPEVNNVRTVEETITGHQTQGAYDPGRWWLAFAGDRPVAVLLTAAVPEWHAWEVSYLGVAPDARRQGIGRELVLKALTEARAARQLQVTLSVDRRNEPAWNLYRELGFRPYDDRLVYLAVWRPGSAGG